MEKRKNKSKDKIKAIDTYVYNPEGINAYDYEIALLKTIRNKWKKTGPYKQTARDLMAEVEKFRQSISEVFRLAPPHLPLATAELKDALKALEKFVNSKLKNKDDHYFTEGINRLKQGLNLIIAQLEQEKETGKPPVE